MNPEFQTIVQQAAASQALTFKDVSRFSPADIRLGIQWLLSEEQNDLAQALADAGIALYPLSEDILAMAGLLAMTRHDWPLAIELLRDLREVQLDRTQPMTYRMLARALYCNLDPAEALLVVEQGLSYWPNDPDLQAEHVVMGEHLMALPATALRS
jgi:hypothetical protein